MKKPPFGPEKLSAFIAGEDNDTITTWLQQQAANNAHWHFVATLHNASGTPLSQTEELPFDEIEACFQDFCAGTLSADRLAICKSALAENTASSKKLLYKACQYDELLATQEPSTPLLAKDELLNMAGVPSGNVIGRISPTVWYALSAAAILLVVVLTQIQSPTHTLAEIYQYESATPMNYDGTLSRGDAEMPADSAGRRFLFEYNNGLSHYMALEYKEARQRWQPLLNSARQKASEGAAIADEFLFYYALNQIALSVQADSYDASEKRELRKEAVALLQESNTRPDATRYFKALALALNENSEQAINLLDSFPEGSEFSQKAQDLRAYLLDAAN